MPNRLINSLSPTTIFDFASTLVSSKGRLTLKEPQRSYMWEMKIVDEAITDNGLYDDFSVYIINATVPSTSVELITRRYLGQEYKVTGPETSPKALRMTVWDDDALSARRYFQNWTDNTSDPDYGRSTGIKAKKDVRLLMKNNGDTRVTGEMFMQGCVITELGIASVDYADNGVLTFEVSLNYDRLTMNPKVENNRRYARNT